MSQQARKRERVQQWIQDARTVAELIWPAGDLPVTEPVMATITYFYDQASPDVDNIPKPILDALKGLVYVDDEQVTDVLCRKRKLNSDFRIENPSRMLAERVRRGDVFLYVVVEDAVDQGVI